MSLDEGILERALRAAGCGPDRGGDGGEHEAAGRGDAWEGGDGQVGGLPIVSCADLLRAHPDRRPAVIDGLLRLGETMNVIASPKVGKSWLALHLAFAIAAGRDWLGTFRTSPGRVLLIDNELHPETSAHRLRTLAGSLSLSVEDMGIDVVNLRGRLQDLNGLGSGLLRIEPNRYQLVIIDAFYRTLPAKTDENDNATMAMLYNQLDRYANALGAAFVLIHHSTKGSQSEKAVTDVGAGAGAQSRATDTHLILRPHEEENVVVLDAAVRSWPPVNPLCLRWDFPIWTPAPDLDPTALRKAKPRRSKPEGEETPKEPPWTPKRFADAFGKPEPQAHGIILEKATLMGISTSKAQALLKAAVDCDYLFAWKGTDPAQPSRTMFATARQPEPTEDESHAEEQIVRELVSQSLTAEAQVRLWKTRTGKGRAAYFRRKKQVLGDE